MIPLTIDISGWVSQFSFSKEETNGLKNLILDKLAYSYEKIWQEHISTLKSTRGIYQGAISKRRVDENTIAFELSGKGTSKIALMIEDGANPFDIKEGFSKSSKKTIKSDGGWYLTIPFRMATSGALAESTVFSGKMTEKVQKIIKEEGKLTTANMPKELQTKGIRKEIQTTVIPAYKSAQYDHKNSIYEGLAQRGVGTTDSHYGTFRRVSDKSYDNSWIHRGLIKRDFMGKSLSTLTNEVDEIINSARREFLDIKFE